MEEEKARLALIDKKKRRASMVLEEHFRESIRRAEEEAERFRRAREQERQEAFEKKKEERLEQIRRAQREEELAEIRENTKRMRDVVDEASMHLTKEERKKLRDEEKQLFIERKVAEEMKRIHDMKQKANKEKREKEIMEKAVKAREDAEAMGVHLPNSRMKQALVSDKLAAEEKKHIGQQRPANEQDNDSLHIPKTDAHTPSEEVATVSGDFSSTSKSNAFVNIDKKSVQEKSQEIPKENSHTSDKNMGSEKKSNAKETAPMEKTESQKSLEYKKTQERIKAFEDGSLKVPSDKPVDAPIPEVPPKKKRGCTIM